MSRLSLVTPMLILLCAVSSQPQSRGNNASSKSAVIILQGCDPALSGNHSGVCYLKLNGVAKRFGWGDAQTRFYNFTSGQAWNRGAEWRVIYERDPSPNSEFVLLSATFTGRIISENSKAAARPIAPKVANASQDWGVFWSRFSTAVRNRNRAAILALAIDSSRFERDAGEDSREDWADRIAGRENKYFVSILNSGFKPLNGGKITRKGCLWFKFIDNRWYWAGTPCD
jgi:hypothetical protein